MSRVDPANVQGFVFSPYRYPLSRHLLFHVEDAAGARAWLRTLLPLITDAAQSLTGNPEPLTNVCVTWSGLLALDVLGSVGTIDSARAEFPSEFVNPPLPAVPGNWKGQFASSEVHLTVHLHCRSEEGLAKATLAIRNAVAGVLRELSPNQGDEPAITGRLFDGGKLHFGFRDGISHPAVNWDDVPERSNEIDLRYFVLGQWSEVVQSHPKKGVWGDFVRDSSYAVFQWIKQDVAAFEAFLTKYAKIVAPNLPLEDARELVAAKMMGRWRNGAPLALAPDKQDDTLADATAFGYADDPQGLRCPLTAHVRIANRRDQPLEPLVASSFPGGGPHLLRRGMPYGAEYRGNGDENVDRGLVGMFICSNLQNQFFTLMNWINKTDFSPVFDPLRSRWQDMIVGNRKMLLAVNAGAIRTPTGEVLLTDLPQFIEVQGTLLLLVPSVAALKRIAKEPT